MDKASRPNMLPSVAEWLWTSLEVRPRTLVGNHDYASMARRDRLAIPKVKGLIRVTALLTKPKRCKFSARRFVVRKEGVCFDV